MKLDDIFALECDVVSPCALGSAMNDEERSAPQGEDRRPARRTTSWPSRATETTSTPGILRARLRHQRRRLVNVAQEVLGYDAEKSRTKTLEIYDTIFDIAERSAPRSADVQGRRHHGRREAGAGGEEVGAGTASAPIARSKSASPNAGARPGELGVDRAGEDARREAGADRSDGARGGEVKKARLVIGLRAEERVRNVGRLARGHPRLVEGRVPRRDHDVVVEREDHSEMRGVVRGVVNRVERAADRRSFRRRGARKTESCGDMMRSKSRRDRVGTPGQVVLLIGRARSGRTPRL